MQRVERVGSVLREVIAGAVALILASGVPAALNSLLSWDINLFPPALVVIFIVATLFGLPTYLILRTRQKDSPISALIAGLVIGGGVPLALVLLSAPDSASIGGTATVVNGVYTAAGWLDNLKIIGLGGVSGASGGLTFWLVIRSISPTTGREGQTSRSGLRLATSVLAAVGVIALIWLIPFATADRSCHNPLRDGRTSIGPVAAFDLHIGMDQWPEVADEMKSFGTSGHWSDRSDVRPDKDFPWLQISLCKEPGTEIRADQGFDATVTFSVFQPQGGLDWQTAFGEFYRRLDAHWPGKISFNDSNGKPAAVPAWARQARTRSH